MRIAGHEDALVVIAVAAEDAAPCARAGVQLRGDRDQQHRHAQQRVQAVRSPEELAHLRHLLGLDLTHSEHVSCWHHGQTLSAHCKQASTGRIMQG